MSITTTYSKKAAIHEIRNEWKWQAYHSPRRPAVSPAGRQDRCYLWSWHDWSCHVSLARPLSLTGWTPLSTWKPGETCKINWTSHHVRNKDTGQMEWPKAQKSNNRASDILQSSSNAGLLKKKAFAPYVSSPVPVAISSIIKWKKAKTSKKNIDNYYTIWCTYTTQ